jgi:hypothetical protein
MGVKPKVKKKPRADVIDFRPLFEARARRARRLACIRSMEAVLRDLKNSL